MACLISGYEIGKILKAIEEGEKTAGASLNLGLTRERITLTTDGASLPDGQHLATSLLEKMTNEPSCFMVENNMAYKIQFFLEETKRMYRLFASGADTAPTAEVAGFRMHRTLDTDPMRDAISKIATIVPVSGRVLDTCTGLGYTAIEAIKAGASEVYTVEKDPGMMRLREVNPWSEGLFDERIKAISGDILVEIDKYGEGFFDAIIHDPPSLHIAGELYSLELYKKLNRVLKTGGMMFHYVGAPGSRHKNVNIAAGVINRLMQAGFTEVENKKHTLGVVAKK
jgi:hypothetical protein